MQLFTLVSLGLALSASAAPTRRASFDLQNGQDAISQNNKFKTLTPDSACTTGEDACVQDKFAQCVGGKFVIQACGPGTICAALPLVNSAGTSITCTTQADLDARIAATGAKDGGNAGSSSAAASTAASTTTASAAAASTSAAKGGNNNNNNGGNNGGDLQTSLTLDPSVLAKGFESDGQAQQEAGQVPSLTSSNNFINFCATTKLPITNGQQIKTGSCNPAPMGVIASTNNMPASKFVFPKNMQTVKANSKITVQMAINNLETGNFVNANSNYYSAPQQVNAQGNVVGHSHFVIEKLDAIDQTKPTNPGTFAFFKGVNTAAKNGVLSVDLDAGLPEGVYRLASINAAANHQPVLVAIAQHGSLDDMVYFFVTADGQPSAAAKARLRYRHWQGAANSASATASSKAAAATDKGAAGDKGGDKKGDAGDKNAAAAKGGANKDGKKN
ncbi:hypothetical protein EVG20_g755 [Dentipellis fragilis]|uniref:Carbohydrate-binding module family 19 domain-containing protein n=1 Tax=Dentipellis fragilis TaxID=205917 RepID=A0A4Y9ZE49_9AGAM|nr:hypothetical protein EVG20_g755 [Dentipellis fragilis]